MWMFLVSKIKQIIKFYFFGNSSFNNFWEYLNKISLKGMNYGEHSIHSSGEAWFLREFNNHLSNQNLLFFDVGANIGLWTSEAVNYLNSSSTVHCFEPLSLNYNILSKRFQKDSRIKLNNLGLSKENLESKIYTVARDSGMSSLYQRKLEHFGYEMENTETIKLTTLDEYCVKNNVDWIDYLKMDVEGHEYDVLLGSKNMLESKKIGIIQYEFGGCNIDSRTYFQDFWYLLNKYYDIYRLLKNGLQKIKQYEEEQERFLTSTFLSVLKNWKKNMFVNDL